MEEIRINQEPIREIKPIQKPITQEPTLKEKVDFLFNDASNVIKRKELKLPRKAKVRKRKLKKGWIGIIKIDENNNASGEKIQLKDSSFITRDKLFHASDGREQIWWNGKFPVFIQEAKKINPKNFTFNQGENETYGQPYVQAKMLAEAIKPKRGGMGIIIWILVIGGGIFLINKLMGGGLFGGA